VIKNAIFLRFLPQKKKIGIFNFPRQCSNVVKVSLLTLYGFCSRFHTLSSNAKILKIGEDLTKLQTV